MVSTDKKSHKEGAPPRSAARLAAVQALYQMESGGQDFRLGKELEGAALQPADASFFSEILRGAVDSQHKLDPYLTSQLATGWRLSRLDATVRAILRAGLFEMIRRPDVPARVVINEYVEIARAFFDGDEPGFINAVLDAAARQARSDELTV